ncbi:hypothetical protein NQ314_019274 [Rhamnusium bicolor]|uniref:FAM192A/Fyv6 N-terminal domain-containing protein n=1 Tax=Rhamnusium bicolor TaxID=1586634 RepID=A0AAV8WN39_9CUCU|nr:hypothetical protein NQ314_019274 [Rhamnusium bicolor]
MSSGFITETEAASIRKRKQEEWERNVQKNHTIHEVSMKGYKNKSKKKDLEYEEAHKLKNMIKGLDDDEIEFLDLVDRTKLEADRKKELEEERELNDYRTRVAILQEKNNRGKTASRNCSIVIKKNEAQKRKMSDSSENNDRPSENGAKQPKVDVDESGDKSSDTNDAVNVRPNSGLRCVAILPGLGHYEDSSSDSSDSEIESSPNSKIDILGRKIERKETCS